MHASMCSRQGISFLPARKWGRLCRDGARRSRQERAPHTLPPGIGAGKRGFGPSSSRQVQDTVMRYGSGASPWKMQQVMNYPREELQSIIRILHSARTLPCACSWLFIGPACSVPSGLVNIPFRNIHRSKFAPAFTITAGILYGVLRGCKSEEASWPIRFLI